MFVSTFILRILVRVVDDFGCWTSKGRHNFLLQHETQEMCVVVIQVRGMSRYLHPDLIVFFQVQRRLEGQQIQLINGAFSLLNINRPHLIPVQINMRRKRSPRWRLKIPHSREREKINSRSRCREYPGCQIHGISLVHPFKIERKRSSSCVKIRISLDVEMDGRRFDVDVSNPFLKTFSLIIEF